MEPRMIGGITSKGQGNPLGIMARDRKVETGMDIAKITRKRSKPDKHGHGNGKSAQESGFSSKAKRSTRPLTLGLPRWQSVCSLIDPTAKKMDPMIARNEWSKSEQAGAYVED
ncbi:hypothetical protein Tco_0986608 [Tanacetum coccineum]